MKEWEIINNLLVNKPSEEQFDKIYSCKEYFSEYGKKILDTFKTNSKNEEYFDLRVLNSLPQEYQNGIMNSKSHLDKSLDEMLTEVKKEYVRNEVKSIETSVNVDDIESKLDKLKGVFKKTEVHEEISLKDMALKFFTNIDNQREKKSVKTKNWLIFNKNVRFYPGDITVIAGRPGCLPEGTEVLTKKGWLDISKWNNEEILEINYKTNTNKIDVTGQFAKPLIYHKYNTTEFLKMKNKAGTMDLISSIEHRHPHISEKGFCREFTTRELYDSWLNKNDDSHIINIPETFEWFGSGINYTDEYIRLKVAVFADGHFQKNRNTKRCYINIKKDRKKSRLEELLKKNNLDYNSSEYANGYKRYSFLMDNEDKIFKYEWFLKTNRHQREIIMDELKYWDGHICEGNRLFNFCTTNKETTETIQLIATSLGYRANLRIERRSKYKNGVIYNLNFSKGTKYGCRTLKKSNVNSFEKVEAGKYMYCFTTNTGFFLIRQNNKIYVTGNSGKTAYALSLALELAKNGSKGIFFSLEMGEEQIINRLVSQISKVKLQNIQLTGESDKRIRHEFSDVENEMLTRACATLKEYSDNLSIVSGNFSSSDILEIIKDRDLDFIIIDYLQLLTTKGRENRTTEITYLSMELKRIAMKQKIHIFELCQLSRAVEQRADKRPMLSDLRESGQIEQDASCVIGLYREGYYNEEADKTELEAGILKNRNGITGTIDFKFYGEIQEVLEKC